jgi:hypothetical protein
MPDKFRQARLPFSAEKSLWIRNPWQPQGKSSALWLLTPSHQHRMIARPLIAFALAQR